MCCRGYPATTKRRPKTTSSVCWKRNGFGRINFASSDERLPKPLAPSGLRTYLSSIKEYIRFVYDTYPVSPLRNTHLDLLTKKIDTWRSNMWKSSEVVKFQKQLDDIERFPSPEEFEEMENSEHFKGAKRLIMFFNLGRPTHCASRGHCVENGWSVHDTRRISAQDQRSRKSRSIHRVCGGAQKCSQR